MPPLTPRALGLLLAGLLFLAISGTVSVVVLMNYFESVRLIEQGGVEQLDSDPVVSIFPAPYEIRVGTQFDLEREIRLLANSGYRQTPLGGRGTFQVVPNRLTIHPTFPEFPDAEVYFDAGTVTQVMDADGKPLTAAYFEREPLETVDLSGKSPVPVRYLPRDWSAFAGTSLADAIVVREDRGFWAQPDLPAYALFRAAWHMGGAGGAGGLVGQLARNSVLADHGRSISRKWREIGVASAILARIPRVRLAELYFNKVRLGGVRGRELIGYPAAARALFGVREVADLSLAQACTIAVLTSAPSGYIRALLNAPDGNVEPAPAPAWWRRWVPAAFVKQHQRLSPKERIARLLRLRNTLLDDMHSAFPLKYPAEQVEAAKLEPLILAPEDNSEQDRAASGHFLDFVLSSDLPISAGRIFTTLDPDLQRMAVRSLQEHLTSLAGRLKLHHPEKLQGLFVALNPQTGAIVAMVGGRNPMRGTLNRATMSSRSPGSAMKIPVFAWSVDCARGHDVGMLTVVDGMKDPIEGPWRPPNHCGGEATLYYHTGVSSNCPPVVLASWIGLDRLRALYREHLHNNPIRHAGMVIGGAAGSEVHMLDLAAVYGSLAADGVLHPPVAIASVANAESRVAFTPPSEKRIFSQEAAFLGLQMMTAPLENFGTAFGAWSQTGLKKGQLYAKTGTGQTSDATFVAILGNRRLVMLAWVGMDDNEALTLGDGFQGATGPMPIVTRVIREWNVQKPWDLAAAPLNPPANFVAVRVSALTGCAVDSGGSTVWVRKGELPGPCTQTALALRRHTANVSAKVILRNRLKRPRNHNRVRRPLNE